MLQLIYTIMHWDECSVMFYGMLLGGLLQFFGILLADQWLLDALR